MRSKTKKRLVILLAGTVLLAGALVGAYVLNQRSIQAQTQQFLADGLAAVEADDRAMVLHNLGSYIKRTQTRDPQILLHYANARASVEMSGGQHLRDAIKWYRLVLDIDPTREEAKRALLDLYWKVDLGIESLEIADEYLAKDPSDSSALWARAISLQRMRRFDEAVIASNRFAQITDNAYGYFMMLEIMQQRDDKPDQIVKAALDVHAAKPEDPRFELLVGYAYTLTDDRANAQKWLRLAATRDINNVGLLRILVAQLDRLSMFDESLGVLTKAAHAGGDVVIRRDLAKRLWESEDLAAVLTELSDIQPDANASDAELMSIKALTLLQMDQREQAQPLIDAVGRVPNSASARAWAGFLREAVKSDIDAQRLVQACRDALQNDPWNAAIRFSLGVAYDMLGETELAIEQWVRCKNERPGWHQPLVRMARSYTTTGRTQQAIEAAGEASARAPNDAEVVIAWIAATASGMDRLSKKDATELLAVIDQIQSAVPGEPQTLAIRVEVLARFRGAAEAGNALRAALAPSVAMDDAALLQLAEISRQYGLGQEQACYDRLQQQAGMTDDLALAQAILRHDAGQTDAGRQILTDAIAQAPAEDQIAYLTAEARYLDTIDHDDALVAWTKLADAHPDHIVVQRQALQSPAVQNDRALLDRTIERLKTLTGEAGITWRLARARYLLDSADVEKDAAIAASLLNDVIRAAPNRVEPQLMLAEAMEKLRDPGGAIDRLTKAAELNPDSPEIGLELADKLIRVRNDPQRARLYLERVLTSPSAKAVHRRQAVEVFVQLGEVDRAVALLEREQQNDDEPELLYASLCWRQGRIEDVDTLCRKLLVAPDAESIAFAADFYATMHRPDEAGAALAKLDSPSIHAVDRDLVLAAFHRDHGGVDDALAHYRRAIIAVPRHEVAWEGYISLLIHTSPTAQIETALAEARKALPSHPSFAALEAQWPTIAGLGQDMSQSMRDVVASLMDGPEFAEPAMATLNLWTRSSDPAMKPQTLLIQSRGLADKYPLYWPAQALAVDLAMEAGQSDEAIKLATRAAQAFPTSTQAAWLACETLRAAGRWAETLAAAQEWRRRAFADPLPADLLIAQARLHLRDSGRALVQLERYMPDAMQHPEAYTAVIEQYARALVIDGQIRRADTLLRPLAIASSSWRSQWITLASQYVADQATAQAWLKDVASMIPADAAAERLTLAWGWFTLSQRQNVAAYRTHVRELASPLAVGDTASADASLLLAYCDELEGDLPAAERHYRDAIARGPSLAIARNNLAMMLLTQKRESDEAASLAKAAVDLEPGNPAYLHTFATALASRGQHDDAIETLRTATKLDPKSVEWPLTLGELLAKVGRKDQALAALIEVDELISRGAAADAAQQERLGKLRQTITAPSTPAGQTVSGM